MSRANNDLYQHYIITHWFYDIIIINIGAAFLNFQERYLVLFCWTEVIYYFFINA